MDSLARGDSCLRWMHLLHNECFLEIQPRWRLHHDLDVAASLLFAQENTRTCGLWLIQELCRSIPTNATLVRRCNANHLLTAILEHAVPGSCDLFHTCLVRVQTRQRLLHELALGLHSGRL